MSSFSGIPLTGDGASNGPTPPDPNSIWKSPFDRSPSGIKMTTPQDANSKEFFEERNKNAPDPLVVVKSLTSAVVKFWKKYELKFVEFWNALSRTSRENFLWCVYPTLPYSLSERYCVENHVKVPSNRYDRYLLINDKSTISNLAEGDNLISMIRECLDPEFLKFECTDIVVKMRELHQRGAYPMDPEERRKYIRELNLKKGDYMYNYGSDGDLFGHCMQVNDPKTLINGTGTLGPDGRRLSLYHWGLIAHPVENNHCMENLYFRLSIVTNAIDEYKEEIWGSDNSDILLKKTSLCANCDSDETELLLCGHCRITCYCSRVRCNCCVHNKLLTDKVVI